MAWITSEKREAIYRRDNYTCGYCNRNYKSDRSRLTLDHIKPRKQGGTNQPTNLITCCDDCNIRKGNRTIKEYQRYMTLNVNRVIRWTNIINRINSQRRKKLLWS